MIHCHHYIDRDTIPGGRKRWDESTPPNFDVRTSALKNKVQLLPYIYIKERKKEKKKERKKGLIKNNRRNII